MFSVVRLCYLIALINITIRYIKVKTYVIS